MSLTTPGGTSLVGPLTVSGATTFNGQVSASAMHMGPSVAFNVITTAAQSANAFAEASGFDKWLQVTVSGGTFAIPLVSASF